MNSQRRRGRLIEHILRNSSLLQTVLEGIVAGKSFWGSPRMKYPYIGEIMKNLKSKSYVRMKRGVDIRVEWRSAASQSLG
jgi:hypothetical protein